MAGNNTKLTPEEVSGVAKKHQACADNIQGQQRTLSGQIGNMTSVNSGAMMQRLTQVHQEWDQSTTRIVQDLIQMAQTLDTAAKELQASDQSNQSQVHI